MDVGKPALVCGVESLNNENNQCLGSPSKFFSYQTNSCNACCQRNSRLETIIEGEGKRRQASVPEQVPELLDLRGCHGELSCNSCLHHSNSCNAGCTQSLPVFLPSNAEDQSVQQKPPIALTHESKEHSVDICGGLPSKLMQIKAVNPEVSSAACIPNDTASFLRTRKQSSIDSGFESPVGPISKNQVYYSIPDETNVPEAQKVTSVSTISEEGMTFIVTKRPTTCPCATIHSKLATGQENLCDPEMRRLIQTGVFQSNARPSNCKQGPQHFDLEAQSALSQQKHCRPNSDESSFSDDVFAPNDQGINNRMKVKGHSSLSCCRARTILCGIVISVVISLVVIAGFVLNQMHGGEIQKLQDKIAQLEESIGQVETSLSSSTITAKKNDASRPSIHLYLKSQANIPVNNWHAKILQWKPDSSRNLGLQYDESKKALIIKDPGTYFVYAQIYVFRHLIPSTQGLNGLSNHTVFHTIFKRPFNYPLSKKPTVVAESALSSCWDANANTQIHSSYQGVIVTLLKNEQLLVALENYDESMDTLNPASTFFGVFKL